MALNPPGHDPGAPQVTSPNHRQGMAHSGIQTMIPWNSWNSEESLGQECVRGGAGAARGARVFLGHVAASAALSYLQGVALSAAVRSRGQPG